MFRELPPGTTVQIRDGQRVLVTPPQKGKSKMPKTELDNLTDVSPTELRLFKAARIIDGIGEKLFILGGMTGFVCFLAIAFEQDPLLFNSDTSRLLAMYCLWVVASGLCLRAIAFPTVLIFRIIRLVKKGHAHPAA